MDWAVGPGRDDYIRERKVMFREQQGQPPSRDERFTLGPATPRQSQGNHGFQVALGEERRSASSDTWAPGRHWGEEGALTRSPGGPGRPAGPGSPPGSSFPSSPAGPGALNTSGTLEGREEGAAYSEGLSWCQLQSCLEAGSPAPGVQLPLDHPQGSWSRQTNSCERTYGFLPWHQCLLCCQERRVHPE